MNKMKVPVFLCGENGKVIYKNEAAKRWISNPRVGSSIFRHALEISAAEFQSIFLSVYRKELSSAVLGVHTTSCYRRALLIYRPRNAKTGMPRGVMLIFLPLLQISNINPNYAPLQQAISRNCKSLARCLQTEDMTDTASAVSASHLRLHNVDRKMTAYFSDLLSAYGEDFPRYDLNYCILMLRRVSQVIFTELGYRVEFNLQNAGFIPHEEVHFLPLSLPFCLLATGISELAADKSLEVSVYMRDYDICIDLTAAVDMKPSKGDSELSIEKLGKRFPDLSWRLISAQSFHGNDGWRIDCRYDSHRDGFITVSLSKTMPDNIFAIGVLHQLPEAVTQKTEQELAELLRALYSMQDGRISPVLESI